MTELNLWLDSYDDIYSDFDSRHYLKRRISEDFLFELKTEMKYRQQRSVDMVLLLPETRRDEPSEKIISNSLTIFFTGRLRYYQDKCRQKLTKGILLLATGIIIMLINSWVSYQLQPSFPVTALKILLDPAGWFLIWAGLDFLLYDFSELKRERKFYKELSDMRIHFRSS